MSSCTPCVGISPAATLLLLLTICCCFQISAADWRRHHRYTSAEHRVKRQFGGVPETQIDLNITVPFIFSARLYPYGPSRGDQELNDNAVAQALVLKHQLTYFGKNYSVIYILRDGAIGLSPGLEKRNRATKFPRGPAAIGVYWVPASLGRTGKVYFRETEDPNVLNLAKNEVQIQFRHGDDFKASSVVIVTWENTAPIDAQPNLPNDKRNLFQISLILSNNGSFAHVVYSKLKWNDNAVAGFNQGEEEGNAFWSMPGSGTDRTRLLANTSDIGIPGEWLFKLDESQVFLCGAGYKGIECIDKCATGEWYYDCARRCHCDGSSACNTANGHCLSRRCKDGWLNPPVCDLDDDECETQGADVLCPNASPDCVNTPGAYLCMCLTGFDPVTNVCRGARTSGGNPELEKDQVQVVPITPHVVTPRIIVPNTIRPRPGAPRPGVTAIQSVGFNARLNPIIPQTPALPRRQPTTKPPTTPKTTTVQSTTPQSLSPFTFPQHLFTTQRRPPVRPSTRQPVPVLTPTVTVRPELCSLKCGQNAHCEIGVFDQPVCRCDRGWSGDGEFCVDVNECFVDNVCEGNSRCQNTPGGYTCLCNEGFYSDGKVCIDVDECKDDIGACAGGNSSLCINTHGGYECKCKEGFNGNPSSHLGCIDINECLIPEFYCGTTADCENTHGSFICNCKQGYQRTALGDDCEDVDECLKAPCAKAASCQNTVGSFACSCITGYAGNGFQCKETILFQYSRLDDDKLYTRRNSYLRKELQRPITILGKKRPVLFVSSNGVVSLDEPLIEYTEEPLKDMPMTTFSPLYIRTDLTQGGHVFLSESTDANKLTRSTLNVHEDFRNDQFSANSVVVITYEDVRVQGSEQEAKNTYQMILAGGDHGTYVTYIYDSVKANSAQAGIVVHPEADGRQKRQATASVLYLPGSGGNASVLRETSNVGVPGKWMFRVDEPALVPCPAGRRGAPLCSSGCRAGTWGENCGRWCRCADGIPCDFTDGHCSNGQCQAGFTGDNCQIDVDECAQLNKCSEMATCANSEGSYTCTCFDGYTGDGFTCKKMDACSRSYGTPCHERGTCLLDIQGTPHCLCVEGFVGDGFTCKPVVEATEATSSPPTSAPTSTERATPRPTWPSTTTTRRTTTTTKATTTEAVTQPIRTFRPIHTPSTTTRRPSVLRPTAPKKPRQKVPDNIDNVITSGTGNSRDHRGGLNHYNQADTSNMLVIIIPAALCGVWLLLIVILLAVCLRRRKLKQADKYGLGYYLPPSSVAGGGGSGAASKNGSTTTGMPMTPSSSAYYGSQWGIPRPNYDYYQGAYYPNPNVYASRY